MDAMRWLAVAMALVLPPVGMVRIPAGVFVMGSPDGEPDEKPPHRVGLPAFDLDRDEVTVAAYDKCVAAGACSAPRHADRKGEEPATWVSWVDADRYCRWVGKRLPTEAEWERAARGSEGRRYPWGGEFACGRGNFANFEGEGRCPNNPGRPVIVGSYPMGNSPEGVRDLAGNVWEWVADGYDPGYYAHSPRERPQGPSSATRRGVRGGACCSMYGLPRASNRLAFPPEYADGDIGFRCAADVRSSGPQ